MDQKMGGRCWETGPPPCLFAANPGGLETGSACVGRMKDYPEGWPGYSQICHLERFWFCT